MVYFDFDWDFSTSGVWQDKEDKLTREFVIPGSSKEEISVRVENKILVLEFGGNKFSSPIKQTWKLPSGTKSKDVSAKYEYGVLTIEVKKPKKDIEQIKIT